MRVLRDWGGVRKGVVFWNVCEGTRRLTGVGRGG